MKHVNVWLSDTNLKSDFTLIFCDDRLNLKQNLSSPYNVFEFCWNYANMIKIKRN